MNNDAHIMQPATVTSVRSEDKLLYQDFMSSDASVVTTVVAEFKTPDGDFTINVGPDNICDIQAGDQIDIHMVPKGASVVVEEPHKPMDYNDLDDIPDGFYRLTSERASMKSIAQRLNGGWYLMNEEGQVTIGAIYQRGWIIDSEIKGMEI